MTKTTISTIQINLGLQSILTNSRVWERRCQWSVILVTPAQLFNPSQIPMSLYSTFRWSLLRQRVFTSSPQYQTRIGALQGKEPLFRHDFRQLIYFFRKKVGNKQSLSKRTIQDQKAFQHAKFRQRRNEAHAQLNTALDEIYGKEKRSLIQSLIKANEYLSSS